MFFPTFKDFWAQMHVSSFIWLHPRRFWTLLWTLESFFSRGGPMWADEDRFDQEILGLKLSFFETLFFKQSNLKL